MILRSIIAVLLLLCWLAGGAQVRPDQFTQETAPNNANFEVYSQKGGLNRRAALIDLKKYFTPDIMQAWQAFTFTDSLGVADSLRMQFLKDVNGRVFYVDQDGDALLLRDTASALGRVYLLPTLADTSTVASPVMGDVGIVGADTLLFYETYWVPFTKGAGGIYSGSGTVPANTWAEFLGAVRFDIDSLGSFSVGDIDETNSGAVISVSNQVGHDGRIIIKSGSGAGFTNAQVQVNNYTLPGKPPSGESLPAGSYMWLVDQGGSKAGTGGTGWFHLDSLLNGYVLGAGTVNTVPLWTASNTLGNSALTQPSATEMSMGTLTGALTLPTGTTAQVPVWADGKLRYNTTSAGFQGGPSGLFLPWADAPNFSAGRIPFSNATGSGLTSSSAFYLENGVMPNNVQFFGSANDMIFNNSAGGTGARSFRFRNQGSDRVVITPVQTALSSTLALTSTNLTINTTGAELSFANSWKISSVSTAEMHMWLNTSVVNVRQFKIKQGDGVTALHLGLGGSSAQLRIGVYTDNPQSKLDVNGNVRIQSLPDSLYPYEVRADANGRLVRQVGSYVGAISTSTDASGDIVVAHGMGTTPTSVQVTVTGTTPYVVTVHTIGGTNFTVRFYDMTGAAVASTAVTATWHCKT